MNYGLSQTGTQFFIAMDDDVLFPSGTIDLGLLASAFENKEVGIVSPWYTPSSTFIQSINNETSDGRYMETDIVPGAFMMFKTETIRSLGDNAFVEPGIYGHHDRVVSNTLHQNGFSLLFDTTQTLDHPGVDDPVLLAWKESILRGETRISFLQWRHLYIDEGPMTPRKLGIKAQEIMATRIFGDKWYSITKPFRNSEGAF